MAVVNLSQAQAEATPYFWSFKTLNQKASVVVAARRQKGQQRELVGANVASVLAKVNSFETYLSNMGVPVTQF